MTTRLEIKGTVVKIYINNLIHLSFPQSEYKGIQAWKEGLNWYCIEFYFEGDRVVKCEYDDIKKWKSLLKEIDKMLC